MICTKENRYGGKLNKPGDAMTPASAQDRRLIVAMDWARDETPDDSSGAPSGALATRSSAGRYQRRDMRAETPQSPRTASSPLVRQPPPPAPAPAPAPTSEPAKGNPVGSITTADFKARDPSGS